jgi:Protein of unknown function (DUF4199)
MKKSPLVGISLRNGFIGGILAVILLIVMYYMGPHPMLILPFVDFRILLFGVFIFFTLKEFRDTYQDGVLHFFQGMLGSFMLVMIMATVAAAGVWIFSATEPDFVADYIKQGMESLKAYSKDDINRIGKEVFDRNLALLPSTNGKALAGKHFGQSLVFGLFLSVILSVILRKQPKP